MIGLSILVFAFVGLLVLVGVIALVVLLATQGRKSRAERHDDLDSTPTREKLESLQRRGHLTEEEFEAQKRRLRDVAKRLRISPEPPAPF
jgi:uncharacterized membrane protein